MAEKLKKNLPKRIGKLPEKWEKMTLEEKVIELHKKWEIFDKADPYRYTLDLQYCLSKKSITVWFEVNIFIGYRGDDEACFALKEPVKRKDFDISKIPEYLHRFIKSQASEDWNTSKKDFNILYGKAPGGNFVQAVENMYFFLDLLAYGYEVTDIEAFKKKHPDLYPETED